MRHNFGLSPFPLTARRPSSTNKRPVEPTVQPVVATNQTAVVGDPENITESTGGDQ